MSLQSGTPSLHRKIGGIIHKDHRVGIAHGDRSKPETLFPDRHGMIHHLLSFQRHRDPARFQDRLSHIDAYTLHLTPVGFQPDRLQTRSRLHDDLLLLSGNPFIIVLGHATDGVAALFRLTSVRIQNPHPDVPRPGREKKDQTVGPHTQATVTQATSQLRGLLWQGVFCNHDKIVTQSVHFCKSHHSRRPHRTPSLPFRDQEESDGTHGTIGSLLFHGICIEHNPGRRFFQRLIHDEPAAGQAG